MGGLMHDIGKLPHISYHDGDSGYDVKKASRHVFDSYNMLLESNELTWGVVATGLLHHDYYGASFGYDQLNTLTKKYEERGILHSEMLAICSICKKLNIDIIIESGRGRGQSTEILSKFFYI